MYESNVNLFEERSESPGHENRLTWALLSLLRVSPIALIAFMDLLRNKISRESDCAEESRSIPVSLSELRERECFVRTQVKNIEAEEGHLISIGITAEGIASNATVKRKSNREGAVYDGVISFIAPERIRHERESLTLVIECKLGPEVSDWQLMPSKSSVNEHIKVYDSPVIIKWRDIFSAFSDLEQREIFGPAERVLMRDFMDFSFRYHSSLNPFDRLERCQGNKDLLQRRCNMIMEEVNEPGIPFHRSTQIISVPCCTYSQIWIYPEKDENTDEWWITLSISLGDTMNQARQFWKRLNADAFLRLQEQKNPKYSFKPNLHFSFISTHLYWAKTSLSLKKYIKYWKSPDSEIAQLKRNEHGIFRNHWEKLCKIKLISQKDIGELESRTTKTKRDHVNLVPGLNIVGRLFLARRQNGGTT